MAKKHSIKFVLTVNQLKILSDFCSDIAKGLLLAAVIGQGFILKFFGWMKIVSSFIWIFIGCVFLFFALYLGKEVDNGC